MKKQYLFLLSFLIACAYLSIAAQDDSLKNNNYGLWAAREFARLAFEGASEQILSYKAAELGLQHVVYDSQYKQLHLQTGASVFKTTCSCGILYIVDYREGDGHGLGAQSKALADKRVYSFFSDGSMGLGKNYVLQNNIKTDRKLDSVLCFLTQSSGVKKVRVRKIKKGK